MPDFKISRSRDGATKAMELVNSGRFKLHNYENFGRYGMVDAQVRDFASSMEECFGTKEHPCRDIIGRLAWRYGHGSLPEAVAVYDDLLDLLEFFENNKTP